MKNKFRIVYYIPNMVHKSRYAIGALVQDKEGIRYLSAKRFPCPCAFDYGADKSAEVGMLLQRLMKNMPKTMQEERIQFTNLLELGEIMIYPMQLDDPDYWLRRYVLPR